MEHNQAQQEAIHTHKGPMILVSCPGSGKTTTMLYRIQDMIQSGIQPGKILMVTFTNAAAREMKERFQKLMPKTGVTFLTIHSLCFNILRMEGLYSNADILKPADAYDYLFHQIKQSYSWAFPDLKAGIKTVQLNLTVFANSGNPALFQPEGVSEQIFSEIQKAYAKWKEEQHVLDFDDMQSKTLKLFKEKPDVLIKWQKRWDYIQVDEYQDTNAVQRDVLYQLSARTKNLCVVGDDDQSIYAFRGANPGIMLQFAKDFRDAKVIRMSTNYRCAKVITEQAANLIGHNVERFDKDMQANRKAEGTIDQIGCFGTGQLEIRDVLKKYRTHPYDLAVLVRTNKEVPAVVYACTKVKIPFTCTEQVESLYESWIFNDITAAIRLGSGKAKPNDFARLVNKPNHYVPVSQFQNIPYNLKSLMGQAKKLQKPYWQREKLYTTLQDFLFYFGPDRFTDSTSANDVFEALDAYGYKKYLQEYAKYMNEDLESLAEIYESLKQDANTRTIHQFLAHGKQSIYQTRMLMKQSTGDGVRITTMHKAKGLEWDSVIIPNCDKLPFMKNGKTNMEEERRLFYVGCTRAENHLYLLYNQDKDTVFLHELEVKPKKIPEKSKGKTKTKVFSPSQLSTGMQVIHKSFGPGQITSLSENGQITIQFPDKERLFSIRGLLSSGSLTLEKVS